MRKVTVLLIAVAFVAAACGDAGTPETATSAAGPTAPATSSTSTPDSGTSIVPATTPGTTAAEDPAAAVTTNFDGPPAPDFFMTLENRSSGFQLSDEQKPVYMVFWAEW